VRDDYSGAVANIESEPEAAPHAIAHDAPPMRELTVRAFFIGAILALILGAANAYLGLFAGMTVSASIPAAVISMALLRVIGGATILENNVVQTIASAGEAVAAGAIFPQTLAPDISNIFSKVTTILNTSP